MSLKDIANALGATYDEKLEAEAKEEANELPKGFEKRPRLESGVYDGKIVVCQFNKIKDSGAVFFKCGVEIEKDGETFFVGKDVLLIKKDKTFTKWGAAFYEQVLAATGEQNCQQRKIEHESKKVEMTECANLIGKPVKVLVNKVVFVKDKNAPLDDKNITGDKNEIEFIANPLCQNAKGEDVCEEFKEKVESRQNEFKAVIREDKQEDKPKTKQTNSDAQEAEELF